MKKKSKSINIISPQVDPYLEGLTTKLVDRLLALEKKIDVVIVQTAGKSSRNSDPSKAMPSADVKQALHRDRILYEAICADCHKVCEVPFKPSEGRPVYCKECFAKRKSGVLPQTQVSKPNPPELETKKNRPTKKTKRKK